MLKRHEIQVLRRAEHTLAEVAEFSGVSVRTVRRVIEEAAVEAVDPDAERAHRGIGRPSLAEPYREKVKTLLKDEPTLLSVEVCRRMRNAGYAGRKSAMYELVRSVRPHETTPVVRFEGLPGEFSQHDFGEVLVRFDDETERTVHFFASRLKYSRWVEA